MSWDKRFDRSVILPGGKTLLTLEDARRHILALPKSEHETVAWQIAIEALLLAAGDATEDTQPERPALQKNTEKPPSVYGPTTAQNSPKAAPES